MKILVVDDELINRDLLGAILRDSYDVIYAADGAEAMKAVRDDWDTVSLVLLDLLMPDMNGLEVLKKMKSDPEYDEVLQAAKYCPYLEIMFGPDYEVIPVLVLTKAADRFDFLPIGQADAVLPVCSGDMLFNVFNEYLGFLRG